MDGQSGLFTAPEDTISSELTTGFILRSVDALSSLSERITSAATVATATTYVAEQPC